MLPAYLTPAYFQDGLVGTPRSVAFSEAMQATLGDGFLFGMSQETGNGDRSFMSGCNDNTSNPTVVRGCASRHWYMNHDRWVAGNSMMIPVKQNSYYVASDTSTCGAPASTLNFVGLGNTSTASFGDWQSVALGTPVLAASDGFLVASIDGSGQNGARGAVYGKRWAAGAVAGLFEQGDRHAAFPCRSHGQGAHSGIFVDSNSMFRAH